MKAQVDERLIRIAKGDHTAFTEIYEQYWKSIFDHVYIRVKKTETTEDIVHDLFLSLWRNKDKIHEIQNITAYLFAGARYLVFTHFNRDIQTKHQVEISDIDIILAETSLEDRLHYRYLVELLHEEIENLPKRCKDIFKASRIDHKSIAEIAMDLNISKSTVENQINIALKRLRKISNEFKSIIPFF